MYVCIFNFRIFFSVMLVHVSAKYIDNISQFLTDRKVSRVLMCSSISFLFEKMDQRKSIKFCIKNVVECAKTFEMYWLRHLASLLWAEHKFHCGITSLRKAKKMSMTMFVLIARACQQPMKPLKQWRKWFWIIAELLLEGWLCWHSQAIFTDVLGLERAAAKIVPKLLNFEKKQCRMDIAQNMLATFNDDSDLLKKVITGNESWVYGYDIETKAQSSSQWKAFGYDWGDKRKIETRAIGDTKKIWKNLK